MATAKVLHPLFRASAPPSLVPPLSLPRTLTLQYTAGARDPFSFSTFMFHIWGSQCAARFRGVHVRARAWGGARIAVSRPPGLYFRACWRESVRTIRARSVFRVGPPLRARRVFVACTRRLCSLLACASQKRACVRA